MPALSLKVELFYFYFLIISRLKWRKFSPSRHIGSVRCRDGFMLLREGYYVEGYYVEGYYVEGYYVEGVLQ
jgi:hypothetical protein